MFRGVLGVSLHFSPGQPRGPPRGLVWCSLYGPLCGGDFRSENRSSRTPHSKAPWWPGPGQGSGRARCPLDNSFYGPGSLRGLDLGEFLGAGLGSNKGPCLATEKDSVLSKFNTPGTDRRSRADVGSEDPAGTVGRRRMRWGLDNSLPAPTLIRPLSHGECAESNQVPPCLPDLRCHLETDDGAALSCLLLVASTQVSRSGVRPFHDQGCAPAGSQVLLAGSRTYWKSPSLLVNPRGSSRDTAPEARPRGAGGHLPSSAWGQGLLWDGLPAWLCHPMSASIITCSPLSLRVSYKGHLSLDGGPTPAIQDELLSRPLT